MSHFVGKQHLSPQPCISSLQMKKAVVLSTSSDTDEIKSLLNTLNVTVTKEYVQKVRLPHKVSFLGPGKIDEVHEEIKEQDVDLIVINGSLKPSQHHFLEMKFQKECVDRTGVILKIFSEHAHTPEAIAQVTLAKLKYEQPFLREWIHKAKSGDRPGFLAGGAYATDVYYEHAKSHARRIERNLEELSKKREVTRTVRREKGYTLVSLSGYTNAGKSALFNRLCNADVEVDDHLFSTLSTTTRKVAGIKGNVLMVDTVGFIRDLPPNLVKAFESTLEEIFYADLILLVFDSGEPIESVKSKLETSIEILLPRIEGRSMMVVGNKMDTVDQGTLSEVREAVLPMIGSHELVFVSALTGDGIDDLKGFISREQRLHRTITATLPLTDGSYSLLSRIRSNAYVEEDVSQTSLEVRIRCRAEDAQKIQGWLERIGAKQVNAEPEGRN